MKLWYSILKWIRSQYLIWFENDSYRNFELAYMQTLTVTVCVRQVRQLPKGCSRLWFVFSTLELVAKLIGLCLLLPPTKEEVKMCLPAFVCLSVCLSVCEQDYSKTHAWIWTKCCVSTDVGTWTNWLTFEPDLDYSPDAGTGLLSPIFFLSK